MHLLRGNSIQVLPPINSWLYWSTLCFCVSKVTESGHNEFSCHYHQTAPRVERNSTKTRCVAKTTPHSNTGETDKFGSPRVLYPTPQNSTPTHSQRSTISSSTSTHPLHQSCSTFRAPTKHPHPPGFDCMHWCEPYTLQQVPTCQASWSQEGLWHEEW